MARRRSKATMSKITRRRKGEFQTPVQAVDPAPEEVAQARLQTQLAEANKSRPKSFHEYEMRDGAVKIRRRTPGGHRARAQHGRTDDHGNADDVPGIGQERGAYYDDYERGGGYDDPYEASDPTPAAPTPRAERRHEHVAHAKEKLPSDIAAVLEALGRQQELCATPNCTEKPTICCAACSPVLGWCDGCDAERHNPAQLLHRRACLLPGEVLVVGPVG